MLATLSRRLVAALAIGALAAMGCGVSRVHTLRSPSAPFATYHTFALGPPDATPARYHTSAQSADVRRRLEPLIISELQRKGYELSATGKPDFVVMFATGRRDETAKHEGWSHNDWLVEDEEADFVEGAIVLDAFQGVSDQQVWHGSMRTRLEAGRVDEALLQRSIHELLESFPLASK